VTLYLGTVGVVPRIVLFCSSSDRTGFFTDGADMDMMNSTESFLTLICCTEIMRIPYEFAVFIEESLINIACLRRN